MKSAIVALVSLVTATTAVAAVEYNIVPLEQVNLSSSYRYLVTDVNDSGRSVGYIFGSSNIASPQRHSLAWEPSGAGRALPLQTIGSTQALVISDNGFVAGKYNTGGIAYRYDLKTDQYVTKDLLNSDGGVFLSMNGDGSLIYYDGHYWHPASGLVQAAPGGISWINEDGVAAISFSVLEGDELRTPAPPEGYRPSVFTRMNNHNTIAGYGAATDGTYHAMIGHNGETIDLLDEMGEWTQSFAVDVSDSGVVVGSGSGSTQRAVRWVEGVPEYLDELIAADSGWRLTYATAISDNGHIVGVGAIGTTQRMFLLTPIPEPQALGVLLLLLVGSARCRR